uniref:Uncharacterized protein n=1 Tax=Daucus carota subsp. sativus TaxID=79200 RepID=A0A162B2E8_DAUCS
MGQKHKQQFGEAENKGEMAAGGPPAAETTASRREGSAKLIVSDQISQAVQSTSNLLQLMLQSSPSH